MDPKWSFFSRPLWSVSPLLLSQSLSSSSVSCVPVQRLGVWASIRSVHSFCTPQGTSLCISLPFGNSSCRIFFPLSSCCLSDSSEAVPSDKSELQDSRLQKCIGRISEASSFLSSQLSVALRTDGDEP